MSASKDDAKQDGRARNVPLNWLLAKIERTDRHANGNADLLPVLRSQIIRVLESCLIDAVRFELYIGSLQELLKEQVRYDEMLEGRSLDNALRIGLRALDDGELIRLALNPIGLRDLHDQIEQGFPSDYWLSRIDESVEAEIEALGDAGRELRARRDTFLREFLKSLERPLI